MKALIHKEKRYICYVDISLVNCWSYQRLLSKLYDRPLSTWETKDISNEEAEKYYSPKREGKLYYYKGI